MLMAMEPIWESDFHPASYGFRPARSVHHAIRTVKLQLQDGDEQSTTGRWVVEGDLASYFDAVHHRLLIKGIRKLIADQRFLALLRQLGQGVRLMPGNRPARYRVAALSMPPCHTEQ